MKEYIYKIQHKPTGLFYCSKKGRFKDEKTNLSKKGNFYTTQKMAENVFNKDCERADINRAQAKEYSLKENGNRWAYCKAYKHDFKIIKYEIIKV